ncbi:MAG: hypothetical protein WCY98_13380 [Castellaniella sp.]
MDDSLVLDIEGLDAFYGDVEILRDVSLQIRRGTVLSTGQVAFQGTVAQFEEDQDRVRQLLGIA